MIIAVVRHGITQWNIDGIRQGFLPNPLHEKGRMQAQAVADYLDLLGVKWVAVYSSPMARTQETAHIIADTLGIKAIHLDISLQERDPGITEQTTEAERVEKWGANWRDRPDIGYETDESVRDRSSSAIKRIANSHADGSVIIVTHGCCMAHGVEGVLDIRNVSKPTNCAITFLDKDPSGNISLVSLNEIEHLDFLEI